MCCSRPRACCATGHHVIDSQSRAKAAAHCSAVSRSCERKLNLDQQVSFLGLRSDVAELLRSFDVYALSSTTEGFSIACIEAMAGGTPVVATRSGGPEDILEHEQSGLLVPTRDPAALADAIERVAMQPAFASTLVANAKERVSARYTLRAMIESYEKLFTRLVKT